MNTISKEYLLLFNAITDAGETLRELREKLMTVQQLSEQLYIEEGDDGPMESGRQETA